MEEINNPNNQKVSRWGARIMLVVVFLIIFVGAFIVFGWYPVMFVNKKAILASDYRQGFDFAHSYYSFINKKAANPIEKDLLNVYVRRLVLEGLIDEVLWDKKLNNDFTKSELREKIQYFIDDFTKDESEYRRVLSDLGISNKAMEKYFLRPNAKLSLIQGGLLLEGKDIVSWIEQQRASAQIRIFLDGASWDGQKVLIREK